ncbi:hypothetical protein [Nakamurella sp.]|uniref:hypothetical protein n=1 Tax=Nakamurella sp. TaxID=1869182 RepID=UPI003B3A0474
MVFEGLARLRWAAGPWRLAAGDGAGHGTGADPVLDHVWPRRDEIAHHRRRIDHGHRTVVVVDDREPVVTLPLERVPWLPFGAVELDGAGAGVRRLAVPRFSWLRERERTRGEAFLAGVVAGPRSADRAADGAVVVEAALLGTPEPLRFVFTTGELSLARLRLTIEQLFRPQPPVAARPPVAPAVRPVTPAARAA